MGDRRLSKELALTALEGSVTGDSGDTWRSGPWDRQDWICIQLAGYPGVEGERTVHTQLDTTALSAHIPPAVASRHREQPVQGWDGPAHVGPMLRTSCLVVQLSHKADLPCGSSLGPADIQGSSEPVSSLEVTTGTRSPSRPETPLRGFQPQEGPGWEGQGGPDIGNPNCGYRETLGTLPCIRWPIL